VEGRVDIAWCDLELSLRDATAAASGPAYCVLVRPCLDRERSEAQLTAAGGISSRRPRGDTLSRTNASERCAQMFICAPLYNYTYLLTDWLVAYSLSVVRTSGSDITHVDGRQ